MSSIILTIGNELLSGHVLDTNTHWLSKRLFFLGCELKNVVVLSDDVNEIGKWIVRFIEGDFPKVDFLFVCGGLGATPDDVTMSAVADALGKGLVVSDEALKHMEYLGNYMYEKGYINIKMEVNEAILKMATVIEGSVVLENKAGFCPGVTLMKKDTRIFILPGVPQELKTIFTSEIEGVYIKPRGGRFVDEVVLSEVEARIAHLLTKLNEDFPKVSVGSYPTYGAKRLVIRAMGENEEDVKRVIKEIRDYSNSLPEF
ncbi:MAG: competence/damage-inducible protein A [Deltaproteobacteria bacterium]|uniref:Competence/damage-inducible protein A n=1 Tax=Candidatus Zymogenus saltonus TaxID=2844893 RepID=A0A9D8KEG0_9DELT|nr:competence/damage-inducible protein A [Candidatus Zymogenus saltonus]